MRLGIAGALKHDSPDGWAEQLREHGVSAAVFPVDSTKDEMQIQGYLEAARKYDIKIAEVGTWVNPMSLDEETRKKAVDYCVAQLKLADRIGAACCVNVSGTTGSSWAGAYKENYSDAVWERCVKSIQEIIDRAEPEHTFYTVEPMPYMIPDSVDAYLQLIEDVDRKQFGVHMDAVNWVNNPRKYFFNRELLEEAFCRLGGHIKSCHLKDIRMLPGLAVQFEECSCGEGNFDIKRYAELVHQCDEDMPLIIEHLTTDEEYLQSMAYVRKLLQDAGIPMK